MTMLTTIPKEMSHWQYYLDYYGNIVKLLWLWYCLDKRKRSIYPACNIFSTKLIYAVLTGVLKQYLGKQYLSVFKQLPVKWLLKYQKTCFSIKAHKTRYCISLTRHANNSNSTGTNCTVTKFLVRHPCLLPVTFTTLCMSVNVILGS